MSALGAQTLINQERSFYLSSIPTDVIHSTIVVDQIDANTGFFSTLFGENITASTMAVSTLNFQNSDVSGMFVSSIKGNTAFFSSMTLASDLSGGVGFVRFSVDASGIQVDGDPIRFDNLVYLTSTINIIQVSTLVDTDIFASNGFFSTLSSGSLSSGAGQFSSCLIQDLSANYGSFDTLFVSTLEALDISGVAASNWSLYPTLNSSITFQPGFVLSNIGNTLWFAGNELTDASGGGQDWSVFPAFSTVQMANQSLVGLSTLQYQDGARLYSLTGNNLFYNGQPVQFGAASNVSLWANYPAVSNVNMNGCNLSNVVGISGSNLALSGSNITNGNTFTNSLGVGGTSLVSLATITSGGDLTCRNIDVGDQVTGLADVNIYGATAAPGDSALYVQGGVQFDGGTIHGFSAGVLPVAGINTGRIDVLQAGFNLLHPLVGAITTGAALGITAGGALSLAGGGYVEMNTSTLQMINTSQGNKNTTIQAGFLTIDPDLAATSSIKLFNTLGGGVEIDGGGEGSLIGFSTVQASNLSSINIDISTINGIDWQDISGGVFTTVSSFVTAQASTFHVSTLVGFPNFGFNAGSTINVETGLQFVGLAGATPGTGKWISSLRTINNTGEDLSISVSSFNMVFNEGVNSNGYLRLGGGGAFDSFFRFTPTTGLLFSTPTIYTRSTATQLVQTSSLMGYGGSPINITNTLQFQSPNAIINVDVINTNPLVIPQLAIGASTIFLDAANTTTTSLSTFRIYTSSLQFSTATSVGSNQAYNYPIFIDYDHAGAASPSAAVAIAVQGHNLGTGAARNQIEFGARANGEAYIMALWPGQNLEDLYIDATDVIVRDSDGFSTIINLNPYGVVTNGGISTPFVLTSSINGGITGTGSIGFPAISTLKAYVSTIQLYEESGNVSPGLSSIMNIAFGYDASGNNIRGMTIENYINYVDNLDFSLIGDADGAVIASYTDYRSSYSELFIYGNDITAGVDGSFFVTDNNSNNISELNPTYLSTNQVICATLNGNDAQPAYTNNIQTSTMDLYAASTTLLYWDSTSASSNINTSGYDTVVGVTGTYKVGVSLQFNNTSGADQVEFFFLKNNSVISQAGGITNVQNNVESLEYCEIVEPLNNGDSIQVGCYTGSADVRLSTINGTVLQSPAAILTMYKID